VCVVIGFIGFIRARVSDGTNGWVFNDKIGSLGVLPLPLMVPAADGTRHRCADGGAGERVNHQD
jgi:hypothetical protein